MPKAKSEERRKRSNAKKTAKQRAERDRPRVYTPNVHEKRANRRANILRAEAVDIIKGIYGNRYAGA
jgi:hypothetical protein